MGISLSGTLHTVENEFREKLPLSLWSLVIAIFLQFVSTFPAIVFDFQVNTCLTEKQIKQLNIEAYSISSPTLAFITGKFKKNQMTLGDQSLKYNIEILKKNKSTVF